MTDNVQPKQLVVKKQEFVSTKSEFPNIPTGKGKTVYAHMKLQAKASIYIKHSLINQPKYLPHSCKIGCNIYGNAAINRRVSYLHVRTCLHVVNKI